MCIMHISVEKLVIDFKKWNEKGNGSNGTNEVCAIGTIKISTCILTFRIRS